jgi:uncharacterized protein YecE (DUF72 family)
MLGKLLVGTSSWTGDGWVGSFYPAGTPASDFLGLYAKKFGTVEIDATWYAIPRASTVAGWAERTPEGFVFAAKVPKTITHEKVLEGCEEDLKAFLTVMERLGPKLGPLLLQFPYFNKKAFATPTPFLRRLDAFLKTAPKGFRWTVEIRNKNWLAPEFFDLLREHGAAYCLIDQAWMPPPVQLVKRFDVVTTDFLYVRWMGDRGGIEGKTQVWDKVVEDKTDALKTWAELLERLLERADIYAYANNHYEGHAPATVRKVEEMVERRRACPDRACPPSDV